MAEWIVKVLANNWPILLVCAVAAYCINQENRIRKQDRRIAARAMEDYRRRMSR